MSEYQTMTDEELERLIAEKYGEGWSVKTLDADDELCAEFIKRLTIGY